MARGSFASTVALSALLGFTVQPLVASALLPTYGGTPAVWNTVALFFQAALLVGYLFAHAAARLGPTASRLVPTGLAIVGLLALPLAIEVHEVAADAHAATAVWGRLASAVGLPAIAVMATAPTLQRWYAEAGHGDPYPLYAASNLGSLTGLLAYPLVFERMLDGPARALAWTVAYGALVVAVGACAWLSRTRSDVGASPPNTEVEPAPSWPDRLRWCLAAAIPSATVLAATAHITTDLAPVPLLWVVPLAVYLGTYICAFAGTSGPGWLRREATAALPVAGAVMVPLAVLGVSVPTLPILLAHISWVALVGLAFHGELSRTRPGPSRLTEFYVWLAVGGVAGGAAITVLAPALFPRAIDYPVLVAVTLFVLPTRVLPTPKPWGPLVVAAAGIAVLALATMDERGGVRVSTLPFTALPVLFVAGYRRPTSTGRIVALVGLATLTTLEATSAVRASRRSFYAAHRVVEDPASGLRWLAHGRTIHGAQSSREGLQQWCVPYHHPHSPIAAALSTVPEAGRITIVGLGVGCMASLRPPRATVRFLELDPAVEALAREHFGFLSACGRDCSVELGDGRVSLRATTGRPPADAIVLDAFASDAVPVHLLTTESIEEALVRLDGDGILAFHITNRHLDLAPILSAAAAEAGLSGRVGTYQPDQDLVSDPEIVRTLLAHTRWVVLARTPARLSFPDRPGLQWGPLPPPAPRPWTDARSSLFDAIR